MRSFIIRRFFQVLQYGWRDSKELSNYPDVRKSRISVFFDILCCFFNHYVFSNQYKKNKLWALSENDRYKIVKKIGATNKKKDEWLELHFSDWNFLCKYTGLEWQKTPDRINKRKEAYRLHYGLGENVSVQNGVSIICEHYSIGKITCGKNVHFARNVDIDYTGDLTIGNNVFFSEGSKVLTHDHLPGFNTSNHDKGCIITPLKINDNVWIGARAIIMPGVKEIGKNARIGAGAVVTKEIPENAVAVGVPAKVIKILE